MRLISAAGRATLFPANHEKQPESEFDRTAMNPEDEISQLLGRLQSLATGGFAMALHIEFTTPAFLFQTYPKAWIDIYSQEGLVMRDPTVMWGFDNLGMIGWEKLADSDEDGIMLRARAFGIDNGFTYATEASGRRSISSFACGELSFDVDAVAEIQSIADRISELTQGLASLSPDTRDALRKQSIRFTHPGS